MSCLTNITTFGKTREGFGTQIISGCHSPSFSYTLLKYVFSLRGAMVQIPLRTTVTLVANPEARRAHRTKPAYHLSSNGQLNAGRSAGRAVGRTGGRTDGRADGRADGWPKPKKSTFLEKKYFLAGRVRDGRLFPYFGRFFPYFRTGRPGAPRQKSTFRKKKILIPVPYHDLDKVSAVQCLHGCLWAHAPGKTCCHSGGILTKRQESK